MKTNPVSLDSTVTSLQVIEGVFSLYEALRREVAAALDDLSLTDALADALWMLDPTAGPVSRRALAESLHCDPSNVTFLADRLEQRGLIERVRDPDDRRVNALMLTPAGVKTRERLGAALVEALATLDFSDRDRAQLAKILSPGIARGDTRGPDWT